MDKEGRSIFAEVTNTLRGFREPLSVCELLFEWRSTRDRLLSEEPPRELDRLEKLLPDDIKAIFCGIIKHKLISLELADELFAAFLSGYRERSLEILTQKVAAHDETTKGINQPTNKL